MTNLVPETPDGLDALAVDQARDHVSEMGIPLEQLPDWTDREWRAMAVGRAFGLLDTGQWEPEDRAA
jgi:hypothetical protein